MRSKILQDFYNRLAIYSFDTFDEIMQLIFDFYFLESLKNIDISPNREDTQLNDYYDELFDNVILTLKNMFLKLRSIALRNTYQEKGFDDLETDKFLTAYQNYRESNNLGPIAIENEIESLSYCMDCLSFNFSSLSADKEVDYINSKDPYFIPFLKQYYIEETHNDATNWLEIYSTLEELQDSSDINTDIILIDHLIDLQHYNGSIFEYVVGGELPESKKFLDIKSNIRSLEEFLPLISAYLKPFANKVIYNLTGRTEEMRNEE